MRGPNRVVAMAALLLAAGCGRTVDREQEAQDRRGAEAQRGTGGAGRDEQPLDPSEFGGRPGIDTRGEAVAQATATRQPATFRGNLLRVEDDTLLLGVSGEPQLRVRLSSQTQVTVDGQPAGVDQLQPGSEVSVRFSRERGEELHALQVDARAAQPGELGPEKVTPRSGLSAPATREEVQRELEEERRQQQEQQRE